MIYRHPQPHHLCGCQGSRRLGRTTSARKRSVPVGLVQVALAGLAPPARQQNGTSSGITTDQWRYDTLDPTR
jgi:hypothetical protein